jgi:hypothetical protein
MSDINTVGAPGFTPYPSIATASKRTGEEQRLASPLPFSGWGTFFTYWYLLRVPFLIALILVIFPLFALLTRSPGRALFENFFDLSWRGSALTSFATLIVTWSLVLNVLIVLFNAPVRFRVPALLDQEGAHKHQRWLRWSTALGTLAISAGLLVGQFTQTDWARRWENFWAVLLGGLAAYVLAYVSLWGVLLLVPPAITAASEIFPAPAVLRRLLARANQWPLRRRSGVLSGVARTVDRAASRFFLSLPLDVRAGFIDDRPETAPGVHNDAYGLPWSGVVLAFAFALLTFVFYYGFGYSVVGAGLRADTHIPALTFVLLLLLNASWILGFSTFFFDRFRVPLLALLLVAAVFGELTTDSAEHFYRLSSGGAPPPIAPAAVLRERVRAGKPIIVVATMGGGIQAAAWTVRVLTGLQLEVQNQLPPAQGRSESFADSVALISSVSGGATGSLFFLSQYREGDARSRPGFAPTDAQCTPAPTGGCSDFTPILNQVFKPRLNDVAWALVYRDLPRILFPYFPGNYSIVFPVPDGRYLDRGRMLERSWQRSGISGRLSDWRKGLAEGWRPASIFNATIAETGEPFRFSTTELPRMGSDEQPAQGRGSVDPSWRGPQPMSFSDLYPDSDIDLVTAARLASGFPYVLPIPRALPEGTANTDGDARYRYHLIDGGYYDNYGVDTAVQWVDQALSGLAASGERLPPKLLIVQIRAFPDIRLPDVNHPPAGQDASGYGTALPRNRGWFFELVSPIVGLLHVRSAGQLLHNHDELLLLKDKWRRGYQGVDIRFATFEFQRTSAPLSFKMNAAQIDDVECVWQHYAGTYGPDDLKQVKCMFRESGDCEQVRQKEPW